MADDADYVTATRSEVSRRLQHIDPIEFEHVVADLWDRIGWETRVVGEPGDRGIDVIATRGEQTQLIQAKRYGPTTTVGSPEVQQYAALQLQEDDVDQVTIVTTGEFSAQAEEMAPDLDVILVDGEAVTDDAAVVSDADSGIV
ncbi:MAG: restriction endonuclease, partial [Haloarculaceae archaeon]